MKNNCVIVARNILIDIKGEFYKSGKIVAISNYFEVFCSFIGVIATEGATVFVS